VPRRRTDLLDVFRAPAAPARPSGRGGGAAARRVRWALGGTIGALLVVLAFVAGWGLGDDRGPPPPRPLAAFRSGEWAIRAEVPRLSPAGAKDLAAVVPPAFLAKHPEMRGRVRLARGSAKTTFQVIVSGFRSKAEAERALERFVTFAVESTFPFRRATAVQVE
jgi:hypothetical protein